MKERALIAIAAVLFVGSAALTFGMCASMAHMPGMEMPGGWTMSMTWMRMPGQGWLDAGASFLGMWSVMMVAMMVPAVTPALRHHYRAVGGRTADASTLRVGAAYFGVWITSGLAVYPLGLAIAGLAMRSPTLARVVPWTGIVALACAGLLQLSAWKERQLECCRTFGRNPSTAGVSGAWGLGVRLGLRCFACCAPLTMALLVLGVMDLGAMAAATAAIALERLAPRGATMARVSGVLLLGAALVLLARGAA